MNMLKVAKLLVVLGISAQALTACTPPMPPEVKAALLEQTYTCIKGSATVSSGEAVADAIPTIHDSMTGVCPDMDFASVASGTSASAAATTDLIIGAGNPAATECKEVTTVPYALDAGVVTASLSQAAGLNLSMATVAGIFDGSITTWNDPKITADNAGSEVATGPITVVPTTDKLALKAFGAWYQHVTGKAFNASLLKPKSGLVAADLGTLADGSIALLPFSTFSVYSVNAMVPPIAATIVSAQDPTGAVPDVTGIGSAGTQLVSTKNANGFTVRLDYNAKPIAPQGSDVAPTPYEAVYPLNLSLCAQGGTGTTATKVAHAVARYLLRQDAQGSLTSLTGLPELLRAESLDAVSAGLPDPTKPN